MKQSIGAFVLLVAAGVLCACNGSNNGFPITGPTQAPSGNCGGPPNQMQVLFPIPGSRKAPPALGNIYVATKGSLPVSNEFDFYLSQSNGNNTYTGPFTQINEGQIPKPHGTPKYSGAVFYASAIAGPSGSSYIIGPNQSVSLFWNDGGRNCVPHFLVSSFHTR